MLEETDGERKGRKKGRGGGHGARGGDNMKPRTSRRRFRHLEPVHRERDPLGFLERHTHLQQHSDLDDSGADQRKSNKYN